MNDIQIVGAVGDGIYLPGLAVAAGNAKCGGKFTLLGRKVGPLAAVRH